jgi:hypothetical protein
LLKYIVPIIIFGIIIFIIIIIIIIISRLLSKNLKIRIYETIMFPLVLYECETWSLTLREEHRLRVFENKVLRRIIRSIIRIIK